MWELIGQSLKFGWFVWSLGVGVGQPQLGSHHSISLRPLLSYHVIFEILGQAENMFVGYDEGSAGEGPGRLLNFAMDIFQ